MRTFTKKLLSVLVTAIMIFGAAAPAAAAAPDSGDLFDTGDCGSVFDYNPGEMEPERLPEAPDVELAAPAGVNVKLNGTAVEGRSLADVVTKAGLTPETVTDLEFVSGHVTLEDYDTIRSLTELVTFKCNLSSTLTVEKRPNSFPKAFPGDLFSRRDPASLEKPYDWLCHEKLQTVEINGFDRIESPGFQYCPELTSVTAHDVFYIGDDAFCQCEKLQNLDFGNVTSISQYAFANTPALKTFDFSKLETVSNYAFIDSGVNRENGVITVTLPATVEQLGYGVFGNGNPLIAGSDQSPAEFHITLEGATPPTANDDFGSPKTYFCQNPAEGSYVVVPEGAEAAYQAHTAYDAEKGTWAGLHLGRPEGPEPETVTLTFVNGETSTSVQVQKGQPIGTRLPEAPAAPDGKVFAGWFNGDVQATAETKADAPATYTARFDLNKNTRRNVRFYVYLDKALHLVEEREPVTTYWIGGRQCLDAETLSDVYDVFGFTAEDLTGTSPILHADRPGDGSFWNAGVKTLDGVTYAATVNHNQEGQDGKEIDVIYLPKATVTGSTGRENAATMAAETFYYVGDEESGRYFVNGETAVIEKKNLPGQKWVLTGRDGTAVDGVKGPEVTTFTIENISQSYTESLAPDVPVVENPVAKIGDTGYATLHDAFAAAQDGDTVTLVKDIVYGISGEEQTAITANHNVTLELDGHKIYGCRQSSNAGNAAAPETLIIVAGTLTVQDARGTGEIVGMQLDMGGYPVSVANAVTVQQGGSLILNSGRIYGLKSGNPGSGGHIITETDQRAVRNHGSVTVNGGEIAGVKSTLALKSSPGQYTPNTAYGIVGSGNVTVNGGSVYGVICEDLWKSRNAVAIQSSGEIRINGGSIFGADVGTSMQEATVWGIRAQSGASLTVSSSDAVIYGAKAGSMAHTNGNYSAVILDPGANAQISGGVFVGLKAAYPYGTRTDVRAAGAEKFITGGIYSMDFAAGGNAPALLADGMNVVRGSLSQGSWTPDPDGSFYQVMRASASYTVRHLQQNVTGDGYTPVKTETLSGTAGSRTEALAGTYEGFTALPVTQKTVEADGSTVVEIRYDRNTFTVTVVENGDTGRNYENVRYGTPFGTLVSEEPVREGYRFTGWTRTPDGQPVTADTELLEAVTIQAQWEARDVCRIRETGQSFTRLSLGVEAARPGETVELLGNVREDMVVLRGGITLDLGGNTLTVDSLVAFQDNYVVDSASGTGRLTVSSGKLVLDKSNPQFPVYREDGYAFGNMVMQQTDARFDPDSDGDAFSIVLKPLFLGDKEGSHREFGNGIADNRFVIGARLGWTRADGTEVSQNFIFSDELVARTYGNGDALILNVSGVAGLENLSVRSFVQSTTGTECYASNGMPQ